MRKLYVIIEGWTEYECLRNVIIPYLNNFGIYNVQAIPIETAPGFKGGDVRYQARYRKHAISILYGQEDMIVTSIIDFYKLRSDFPNYQDSLQLPTSLQKVDLIERGIMDDINDNRFIPYIQLHEFESLCFASHNAFDAYFDYVGRRNIIALKQIVESNENAELINGNQATAPSSRLKNLIPNYDKALHGPIILMHNGIEVTLSRCPRFKVWLDTIIQRMLAP